MDSEFIELIEECDDWHRSICNIGLFIQITECKSWVKLDTDSNEIIFDVFGVKNDSPANFQSVIPSLNCNMERSNFYLFAGLCVGYLIWYLEKLSEIIFRYLQINVPSSMIRIFHPGVSLIYNWIGKLIGILK